ncbi:MAG: hypothetical protein KGH53_00020 [Candidatus Micrarchaeota archaeon]|nr:hypothetical protein [Candidatus Micrarchaeota archaeon]
MQIISDKVRPEQDALTKPWLNIGFFAGRASSDQMAEHSKKVFDRATKMIEITVTAARNSGDVQLLKKVEKLKGAWQERARAGIMERGMRELKVAVGLESAEPSEGGLKRISDGLAHSNVNLAASGLQRVLNPYAKQIWGDSSGADELNDFTEESKQYNNKSEAILARPLWRRGLERIWQSLGLGIVPRSTANQLEVLKEMVDELYAAEVTREDGEIGKWFEDYSHKTFVVQVLAKARETGSLNGIRKIIEGAIETPSKYYTYDIGSATTTRGGATPPGERSVVEGGIDPDFISEGKDIWRK